jgi:hypothetical protein
MREDKELQVVVRMVGEFLDAALRDAARPFLGAGDWRKRFF